MVVLVFTLSFFVLLGAIPLAGHHPIASLCAGGVLLWPTVAIALFLVLTFALGCQGVRRHQPRLKILYLVGLLLAVLALLAFVVFGYGAVGGVDFGPVRAREYRLADYSGWLRGRVADPRRWAPISACVRERRAGGNMRQLVRDPETGVFVSESSTWANRFGLGHGPMPIESGCCKPPSSCGLTYVNGDVGANDTRRPSRGTTQRRRRLRQVERRPAAALLSV